MNKERQTEFNEKSYAKKLGMILEEYREHKAKKREAKSKKNKRAYKNRVRNRAKQTVFNDWGGFTEAQHQRFKEKHREFEGTRLEKSINRPVFLTRFGD